MLRLVAATLSALLLSGCSAYELAQVSSIAVPVATHAALSGAVLDAAINDFDRAGTGTSARRSATLPQRQRPASSRRRNLRPARMTVNSRGRCIDCTN